MAIVPERYLEDLTGTSPNNKVVGDVYQLSSKEYRAVAVRYGPFFGESVVVYDDVSNVPLVKDKDYTCIGLLPDLSSRCGKGVYDALMIVKKDMGNRVRLDYQSAGSKYNNQSETIAQLADALAKDNRPVDYITGVFNKPIDFPPSLHSHWLNDVVGWGPIVSALDRIATNITIGQAPVFNFLLDQVRGIAASEQEIRDGKVNDRFITPEGLHYALSQLNFNAMHMTPYVGVMQYENSYQFTITTNRPDDFRDMYWCIEHETTEDDDFAAMSGEFIISRGEAIFSMGTGYLKPTTASRYFRLVVKRDGPDGAVMLRTNRIRLARGDGGDDSGITSARMNELYSACCIYDTKTKDPLASFMPDKEANDPSNS